MCDVHCVYKMLLARREDIENMISISAREKLAIYQPTGPNSASRHCYSSVTMNHSPGH